MSRTLKPRPHPARLDCLPADQREQLLQWLRENKTYRQLVQLMGETFGCKTNTYALSQFYRKNVSAILGTKIAAPVEAAAGVAVTITCRRPGEIKLAIHPLREVAAQPGDGEAALCASGVEVVALCQREGEIRLAVYPVRADGKPTSEEDARPA